MANINICKYCLRPVCNDTVCTLCFNAIAKEAIAGRPIDTEIIRKIRNKQDDKTRDLNMKRTLNELAKSSFIEHALKEFKAPYPDVEIKF